MDFACICPFLWITKIFHVQLFSAGFFFISFAFLLCGFVFFVRKIICKVKIFSLLGIYTLYGQNLKNSMRLGIHRHQQPRLKRWTLKLLHHRPYHILHHPQNRRMCWSLHPCGRDNRQHIVKDKSRVKTQNDRSSLLQEDLSR